MTTEKYTVSAEQKGPHVEASEDPDMVDNLPVNLADGSNMTEESANQRAEGAEEFDGMDAVRFMADLTSTNYLDWQLPLWARLVTAAVEDPSGYVQQKELTKLRPDQSGNRAYSSTSNFVRKLDDDRLWGRYLVRKEGAGSKLLYWTNPPEISHLLPAQSAETAQSGPARLGQLALSKPPSTQLGSLAGKEEGNQNTTSSKLPEKPPPTSLAAAYADEVALTDLDEERGAATLADWNISIDDNSGNRGLTLLVEGTPVSQDQLTILLVQLVAQNEEAITVGDLRYLLEEYSGEKVGFGAIMRSITELNAICAAQYVNGWQHVELADGREEVRLRRRAELEPARSA